MDKGVFLFRNVTVDNEFINEIFSFDVSSLESTDGLVLSKYAIALGQYLIYFKSEVNKTKANLHNKQRIFESTINTLMTDDVLRTYKTKVAVREYFIQNSTQVNRDHEEIEKLKEELTLVDGIDKTVSDLIATFKRELTRRENELWQIRQERK